MRVLRPAAAAAAAKAAEAAAKRMPACEGIETPRPSPLALRPRVGRQEDARL